jgi:hypothetical protein
MSKWDQAQWRRWRCRTGHDLENLPFFTPCDECRWCFDNPSYNGDRMKGLATTADVCCHFPSSEGCRGTVQREAVGCWVPACPLFQCRPPRPAQFRFCLDGAAGHEEAIRLRVTGGAVQGQCWWRASCSDLATIASNRGQPDLMPR